MKKTAPVIAFALGACVTHQTKLDVRDYVAANWESFEERMQRGAEGGPRKLEFVDVDDLRCQPIGDAFDCSFQITGRTESGELASGKGWGTFAYSHGKLTEVIIVG